MATLKQKRAVKKILENPRKSVSAVMREVGYSKETAKVPSDLTNSKGWKELMEKHLPDKLLLNVHKDGLEAERSTLSGFVPDYAVRHSYLDSAYKIKGKFKDTEDVDPKTFMPIQINVTVSSNPVKRPSHIAEAE